MQSDMLPCKVVFHINISKSLRLIKHHIITHRGNDFDVGRSVHHHTIQIN